MRELINNEKGNAIYLTIWTLFVVGLMLALIMNFGRVYTLKEQSFTAAQQASIAATSVVYEEIIDVINDYEPKDEEEDEEENGEEDENENAEPEKTLAEKVDEEKDHLQSMNPDLSENEAYIQAINNVLLEEIPDDSDLKDEIESAVYVASSKVVSEVQHIISSNHGQSGEAQIRYFNDDMRIEVETTVPYDQIAYGEFLLREESDIPQTGVGLELTFLEVIDWHNSNLP